MFPDMTPVIAVAAQGFVWTCYACGGVYFAVALFSLGAFFAYRWITGEKR